MFFVVRETEMADWETGMDRASSAQVSETAIINGPGLPVALPPSDRAGVQAERSLSLSSLQMEAMRKDISRHGFAAHPTHDRTVLVEPLLRPVTTPNGEILTSGYSIAVNWDKDPRSRRSVDLIVDMSGSVVASQFTHWQGGEVTKEQPAPRPLVQEVIAQLEKAPMQEWIGRNRQGPPVQLP